MRIPINLRFRAALNKYYKKPHDFRQFLGILKYDAKWKNNRNVFVANAKTLLVFSQPVYLGKVHLAEKEIESYD